jgi:hypothetical protein
MSAVWDLATKRNWKVRAEGGKNASKSSKERARGHRKMRSIRKLKDKYENQHHGPRGDEK